jgi:hypothetical protein
MEIKINGHSADVTVDNEKTIGDVMAGIESWLANSGHRLSGFSIDGKAIVPSALEEAFSLEIDKIQVLDILTSSMSELTAMSLVNLIGDLEEYGSLGFEEKKDFYENWKQRPETLFIAEQMNDLFDAYCGTFLNGAFTGETLRSITEERLREVQTPVNELVNLRPIIEETCERLVDLPLDIQTGKDVRAAQTMQLFSSIAEKIFRILKQLDSQGYLKETEGTEKPIYALASSFGMAVKDLLEAYETNDTVLVGDLTEYEMAPRLQELYNEILKNSFASEPEGNE